jgi:lactoylglutathione lyase
MLRSILANNKSLKHTIHSTFIRMSSTTTDTATYRFNHTMFRIKDPKVTLPFYEKVIGMEVSPYHTKGG